MEAREDHLEVNLSEYGSKLLSQLSSFAGAHGGIAMKIIQAPREFLQVVISSLMYSELFHCDALSNGKHRPLA